MLVTAYVFFYSFVRSDRLLSHYHRRWIPSNVASAQRAGITFHLVGALDTETSVGLKKELGLSNCFTPDLSQLRDNLGNKGKHGRMHGALHARMGTAHVVGGVTCGWCIKPHLLAKSL